jgi:hypothetical protein
MESVFQLAIKNRVRRVRLGEFEFELDPSAFAPAPMPVDRLKDMMADSKDDQCACGHSLSTEHNQQGCLHGCDVEKCVSTLENLEEAK